MGRFGIKEKAKQKFSDFLHIFLLTMNTTLDSRSGILYTLTPVAGT